MAREANKRNVVVIITHDDGGDTCRGRGVEVQEDGTLVLGTAQTSSVGDVDAVKNLLIQPNAPGGSTPENSALYAPDEILAVHYVPRDQIDFD